MTNVTITTNFGCITNLKSSIWQVLPPRPVASRNCARVNPCATVVLKFGVDTAIHKCGSSCSIPPELVPVLASHVDGVVAAKETCHEKFNQVENTAGDEKLLNWLASKGPFRLSLSVTMLAQASPSKDTLETQVLGLLEHMVCQYLPVTYPQIFSAFYFENKNPTVTLTHPVCVVSTCVEKAYLTAAKLSEEEKKMFRLYGKLPNRKDLVNNTIKERKYFDSGDYVLSKVGKNTQPVGEQHPSPETIPHQNPALLPTPPQADKLTLPTGKESQHVRENSVTSGMISPSKITPPVTPGDKAQPQLIPQPLKTDDASKVDPSPVEDKSVHQ
ncbi:hypothetical protein IWQ62_000294 [Dispira parvispora]|uniref:mRNA stability protein n=1 Tax=Dispira parvispora TaxID=1520584 RepID=A0A9W8AUS8_9FUNG|nr:hypothetical protein IWQ62_000294 [Dispira parvispora]